jgi:hypothetical protein
MNTDPELAMRVHFFPPVDCRSSLPMDFGIGQNYCGLRRLFVVEAAILNRPSRLVRRELMEDFQEPL